MALRAFVSTTSATFFALTLAGCAAESSSPNDVTTTAAAETAAAKVQEFRIDFEPGNKWGGYGDGLVDESAVGSDGAKYYLTGGGYEYDDDPEVIHSIADADSSLRIVYWQDGIWDGWYSESESGPGPVPHKLVDFTRVELQYRIDGGPIQDATLASPDGVDGPSTVVHVPADAAGKTLEYWFKITGGDGKTYWESRNAKNYHVEIKPAGGTDLSGLPHSR
jgi:hypothetical protein